MSMPIATPYGIRDCRLARYTDAAGSILPGSTIDLPYMQTFSFSETEEFTELRGDDTVVATKGQGAQVDWSLESGGISFEAWAVLSGGSVTTTGVTPNRRVQLRKIATDNKPYFRIEGQSISDSGGDVHGFVYRCKANDAIDGEFADGEFFITSCSGLGLPLLTGPVPNLLYEFIQNETAVATQTVPVNPAS